MAKRIYYISKTTAAKTEYREVTAEDRDFVLNQMLYSLVTVAAMSNDSSRDIQDFLSEYWRCKTASLPRGRAGQNTPETFIAGLLENMLYAANKQRDFSAKQTDALERIFIWLAMLDPQIQELQFQVRTH